MNVQTAVGEQSAPDDLAIYLDTLGRLERLHRLLLDVVKDEFERLGLIDINSVQGLLLFNIGEQEVTAGELKSRGYYQGSNVSYNLKKLVEFGYMHHEKCKVDRRAVRVKLTDKGKEIRTILSDLFATHVDGLVKSPILGIDSLDNMNTNLRQIERFWSERIRFIY
ncbi:MAG: winged helix DNA-binding protein [Paracoccaceae bacterium]